MKWFANEGILVEDVKPDRSIIKMEYPIHNWLMSAFKHFWHFLWDYGYIFL